MSKQSVLGQPPCSYKKAIDRQVVFCLLLAAFTLAVNAGLTFLRTPDNHTVIVIANIAVDLISGYIVLYRIFARILPCRHLYALFNRPRQRIEATVTELSGDTVRYMDMDCCQITVQDRRLFVPVGTLRLSAGKSYLFSVASNIILEAEE